MSGVRRDASARPMLSGATIEWLPEFGASWQVVQVPWKDAGSGGLKGLLKFSPATPEIVNAFELKVAWPRATARRASLVLSLAAKRPSARRRSRSPASRG